MFLIFVVVGANLVSMTAAIQNEIAGDDVQF